MEARWLQLVPLHPASMESWKPRCTSPVQRARLSSTIAIHIACGIARSDLGRWEDWLKQQGIAIEERKTWKYGGEALYFRDPDGHLLEVVTPGVWTIY